MIAQTISMKLNGRHYEAFRSFALRSGATTTTENVKRLIESLPEYKSLLNIHENDDQSIRNHCNKTDDGCQGEQSCQTNT